MSEAQTIAMYQPMLVSVAYRMVKNLMDAEDIVQDTLLRFYSQQKREVENLKAYLLRAVVNNCLNHIKKLKQKGEELLDPILHAQWLADFDAGQTRLELEADMQQALARILQKLEPNERIVYLFREAFNFDYAEIAELVEKKKDNCRQLFCRAQAKLNEERERFSLNVDHCRKTLNAFFETCREGNFGLLQEQLKKRE
jgi:RNA polymerase sigma factor (sigma-70 family)